MKKVLLIVNPVSGRMKSKTTLFNIIEQFCKNDYIVTTQITSHSGHAKEIVQKNVDNEYDLMVCCGGDGTLNELISGLLEKGSKIPFGYIPSGSTNDFANSLKLSGNISKATKAIFEGTPHQLDIGNFNNSRYFSYIASFGAFTAASYNAPQATKNALGHLAYILEGVKELSNIQPYHVRIETNDKVFEDNYIFCAVTNSTSVGGIVKLGSGLVDMSDGLFEIILIKNPKTVFDLNKIITSLSNSNLNNNDMINFFKADKIKFIMNSVIPWSLDGEYEKGDTTVIIENLHNAITLIH